MNKFLTLLLNGLSLGAIYALIALGFVIIFKASEVVSFMHGSLLLLGAYTIARLSEPIGFYLAGARRHRDHGAASACSSSGCSSTGCAARRSSAWRSSPSASTSSCSPS